ncbi:SDR family NAD(P)-dependent oxidoreductase [Azospirillum halopraeferens]|uniref:SDR family NAD(P)-dependent oxidoreductase n=1 Tax=Azospirillum halopraeferens TaxID=34010 RepID=UPI0004070BFB|nr:SDR family NAD(P)-dependent oxidoreductase [Azospirillum halopraeferens]
MDIRNLAAVVTGGGSGLGAATARALAAAGARVTVLDVNEAGAKATAEAIGGLAVACDVTDPASVQAALAQARDAHGPVRVAVSCAGIVVGARVVGKKGAMPLETFSKVVTVNLIGTFNVMRLAAEEMLAQDALNEDGERGVIVNTASVAAFEGQVGQCAYSASKGGVAALTLPAAREFAPRGVRVVAIAPGLFETPMMAGMPPDVHQSLINGTLHPHRLGRPEEFARLALHIVENPMLNGTTLRLDGAVRLAPQ